MSQLLPVHCQTLHHLECPMPPIPRTHAHTKHFSGTMNGFYTEAMILPPAADIRSKSLQRYQVLVPAARNLGAKQAG